MEDNLRLINVLVVDDSSLMRKFITKMLEEDPGIRVVATAINGIFALKKVEQFDVDIILLDIEMPEMNGIDFLKKCKELDIDIPIIMLSALGRNRPRLTLECINLGAKDFIVKPSGTISLDIHSIRDEVISKIKFFHATNIKQVPKGEVLKSQIDKISKKTFSDRLVAMKNTESNRVSLLANTPSGLEEKLKTISSLEVVVIGISTGGPYALRRIIPCFPSNFPLAILIVQHMPVGFTYEFTRSLDEICHLRVKEAEDEDILQKGTVYIAPGNKHLLIRYNGSPKIKLSGGDLVCGHRPSVEVLFDSAYEAFNNRIISVIMTGMGKDGARAIKRIRLSGGIALAQDEKTSVVFGMPKVAIELGGVDEVLKLDDIPKRIIDITSHFFKLYGE